MNKDKFLWFLKKFFFIHPIAIVLIFIINSYELVRYNESVSRIEILIAFILTSLFIFLFYFLFKKSTQNVYKAAFLSTTLFTFCFCFADITNLFFSIKFLDTVIKKVFLNKQSTVLFTSLTIIFVALFYYIRKSNINIFKLTWFINILSIIFFIIRIIQFSQHSNSYLINYDNYSQNTTIKSTPNIYYIILDSYTGNSSLKLYWNFDNSELTTFLKNKGFYITKSNSNYNWTPFSLSSSLNMSYLMLNKVDIFNEHFNTLLKLIKESRVANFLKKNDYELLNYSFFDVSDQAKYYKDYFFVKDNFFSQSIFSVFYDKIYGKRESDDICNLPINNLTVINKLKDLRLNNKKHYFIYAHLLLPHFPYFFRQDGKQMPLEYANDAENQDKYLEQLKYTNKLIIDCIETIISKSTSKPIIIIQGDHGFRYLKTKDQLSESFTILNAFLFPDNNYCSLYNSISPVNSFRVVFNQYFDTKLPLLKDSSVNVLPKTTFTR